MRSVELQKTSGSNDEVLEKSAQKLDSQEERRIRKQIASVEKEIANIENELGLMALQLADPNFYSDRAFHETHLKYKVLEEKLETKMSDWENLNFELDANK